MTARKKKVPKPIPSWYMREEYWLLLLRCMFYAVIVLRYLYPFVHNPYNFLTSDPAVHWGCGIKFFTKNDYCYSMPKLFQVWVYLNYTTQQLLPESFAWPVMAFYAGVLSAVLPWGWYRALKEIFTRKQAYIVAIAIGVTPSLVHIYAFLMNETITLAITPLVFWTCFRAARKREMKAFLLAIFVGTLAMTAKFSLLPLVLLAFGYAYHYQPKPLRSAIYALMVIYAVMFAFKMHSYLLSQGKSTAALRNTNVVQMARLSSNTMMVEHNKWGYFWSASPSMYVEPLAPLSHFSTYRKGEFVMNNMDGSLNRDLIVEMLRSQQTPEKWFRDLLENNVFLFFSPSWPDMGYTWDRLQVHTRWIWAPIMLFMLFVMPFRRWPKELNLILLSAWSLTVILMLQQIVIMEGRYRKPIEPLLLICFFGAIFNWRSSGAPVKRTKKTQNDNMYGFIVHLYILMGIARAKLIWHILKTMWENLQAKGLGSR